MTYFCSFFWKKLRTQKRYFKTNWPSVAPKISEQPTVLHRVFRKEWARTKIKKMFEYDPNSNCWKCINVQWPRGCCRWRAGGRAAAAHSAAASASLQMGIDLPWLSPAASSTRRFTATRQYSGGNVSGERSLALALRLASWVSLITMKISNQKTNKFEYGKMITQLNLKVHKARPRWPVTLSSTKLDSAFVSFSVH